MLRGPKGRGRRWQRAPLSPFVLLLLVFALLSPAVSASAAPAPWLEGEPSVQDFAPRPWSAGVRPEPWTQERLERVRTPYHSLAVKLDSQTANSGRGVRDLERSASFRVLSRMSEPLHDWIVVVPQSRAVPLPALLRQLSQTPGVVYVEPNFVVEPQGTLDPPGGGTAISWNLGSVRASYAWGVVHPFPNRVATVGVVDSGLDTAHLDLEGMFTGGWNLVRGNSLIEDTGWHGTAVSSVFAARAWNNRGIDGLGGPRNQVRVRPYVTDFTWAHMADATKRAADSGAMVINHSYGSWGQTFQAHDAFIYAHNKGCLHICAAPNETDIREVYGTQNLDAVGRFYPMSFTNPATGQPLSSIIAVSSSDRYDNWAQSYGRTRIDLYAPGEQVPVLYPGGGFAAASGTSFAVPHVAGAVALLQTTPGSGTHTASAAKRRILETVRPVLGVSNRCATGGVLNVGNLLRNLRIAGKDRYETAEAASQAGGFTPSGTSVAVVAAGESFADALSAPGLSGAYSGPLLLTRKDSLPAATERELRRLGVSRVFIVGGEGVISKPVRDAIFSIGSVTRVDRLDGADRYETAVKVANQIKAKEGTGFKKFAFFVRGDEFPDGLAVGPLAYNQRVPILLVRSSSLPEVTRKAIVDLGITEGVVIGAEGAINSTVFDAIRTNMSGAKDLERVGGNNRYTTAVEVAKHGISKGWAHPSFVGIATGADFPDALGGGVAAGNRGGVLLLTTSSSMHSSTRDWVSLYRPSIDGVQIYGLDQAVSPSAMHELDPILAR